MQSSYLLPTVLATVAVLALLVILVRLFFGWNDWRSGRQNVDMSLDTGVRHLLDDFLTEFGRRMKWNPESTEKLRAAGEEVLMTLAGHDSEIQGMRRLRVSARRERDAAVIEFLASPQGTNLEEQIRILEEHADPAADDLSLRLLGHYASSVRHRHYHLNDLLTVRVEGTR